MPADLWLNETLYAEWGQRFLVDKTLAIVKSHYQDILVFESSSHGRVLVLDGCVQITERDEFMYQEMLGHVPMLSHNDPKRVLIIGAGDGGVLKRVLLHSQLESVVLVEIDGEVIRLAQEFMPSIGGDAWSDKRSEVIVGDGIDFVRRAEESSFDLIIVDSTDPIGVGETLFTDEFYENCARVLTSRGLIVNQCGVPFMQPTELSETSARRRRFFPYVSVYVVAVPTYVGGLMALGIASKDPAFVLPNVAELRERAEHHGVLGKTSYWTPEIQVSSFNLPPYISKLLT